jgi:hypothetical protein
MESHEGSFCVFSATLLIIQRSRWLIYFATLPYIFLPGFCSQILSFSVSIHVLDALSRRSMFQRWEQSLTWSVTCSDPSKLFPYCMLHACSLPLSHRMHFQCTFSGFYSIFSLCLLWTCSMSSNLVSGRHYLLTCWGSYSPQEDQQSKVSTEGKFEFVLQLSTVLIYITDTRMYPHLKGEQ